MTSNRRALIKNLENIVKLNEFPPGGSGSISIGLHTMQEIIEVLKFDEQEQENKKAETQS